MDVGPDVLLLRSADEPDRYLEAFADAGLQAVCEPVLAFSFPNQQALTDALEQHDRYGALIVTSPRAATALERAFDQHQNLRAVWENTIAYAVGPKTAGRLQKIGLQPRGEEAGNAEALSARIVEEAPNTHLLFLCGNRRRDTLPDRLREDAVAFEELVVYETRLRRDLSLPAATQSSQSTWLVFFSPSGLEAVEDVKSVSLSEYRIASIGPTTAGTLVEAGYDVEAVAEEPSPEALVTAIKNAEA